jgi:hypothetical protein
MYSINTYIEPGDVIIVRGPTITSKAIAFFTRGHFLLDVN